MAQKTVIKTTFKPEKVIRPIYGGGSVSLSQDGRILATCLGDDAVLTNIATGEQITKIEGDGGVITSLLLTPSASHLIICSRSFLLRIFSLSHTSSTSVTAILARTIKPHSSPVITTAVDPTGTLLATGTADGVVKVWDIRGGFPTHTFYGHAGLISALNFFEVEDQILLTKRKRKGKTVNENEEHSFIDRGIRDSPQGVALASGSEDGKIRVWNLKDCKVAAVLDSHVSVVRSLEFDADTKTLISASRDKSVILWNAWSWTMNSTIPILESVEKAGWLRSGSLIYTGGENGRLRIWDVRSVRELTQEQSVGAESDTIVDVISYRNLPYILSVHADFSFQFHSKKPLEYISDLESIPPLPILRRISGSHDEVIDFAFINGNRPLLAVATNTESIKLLSLDTARSSTSNNEGNYFGVDVGLLQGHEDVIICLDVDYSGHWLATGAKDNTARLWRRDPETDTFDCFATFTGHAESISAIALPRIATVSGPTGASSTLDQPPLFLLTGSQDKTIKRWDSFNIQLDTKRASRATYTRKAHDKGINSLDINHTSTFLASASQDRLVKIWSLENGESVGVLRGHRRGVWSVKFSPRDISPISGENGAQISPSRGLVLTGSGDRTVKIWSLGDYSCIRTFEGHTNSVLKVIWMKPPTNDVHDKRGVQLASAGGDGLVKIWDANSGELECTLDNHEDRVWALTLQPDTNELISGGGDGLITFWKDMTWATAATAADASTTRMEQDQQLQNYIHGGSYRQAIVLALQLNHPARLLSLFAAVVAKHPANEGSLCGDRNVDEVLGNLSDEQLLTLLLRIRDWNTNMKTAAVAQRILWTLFKSYPASRFTNLTASVANNSKQASLKEIYDVLKTYTERQYRRMEELMDESYLVEYTLREMDEIRLNSPLLNDS